MIPRPPHRHLAVLVLVTALVFPLIACAQEASLSAPTEAIIGSKVNVRWTGPGDQYDPIYLVAPGAGKDAKALSSTSILSRRNPVILVMPEQPGEYDIIYKPKSVGEIAARTTISVVDVPTSIDAPDQAKIGEVIKVGWTGPGNSYDSLSLYAEGSADSAKAVVGGTVLQGRKQLTMKLPEEPGKYELRYLTRQARRVLARKPIVVEGVATSLSAPDQVDIGSTLSVEWEGPGNDYDLIALYPEGAPSKAKSAAHAAILSKRNPVTMRVPEESGTYELRYITSKSKKVLATRSISIGAVAASLDAPERATAASEIEVSWSGPGNQYDHIGIFKSGAPDSEKPLAGRAILSKRNPVQILLPEQKGEYELRYRTAQTGKVLARKPIVIEPAGKLAVVFEREGEISTGNEPGADGASANAAVELILDASGSMLQRIDGVRRIEIARDVLTGLVNNDLSDDMLFALRVFGHKSANACRTDLEIPLSELKRPSVVKAIAQVNAKNLAKTPIADSLAQVPVDLAGAKGPKTVILITDGEETCEGDPEEAIRSLKDQGLDVQVSIVGFAIEDPELKEKFQLWAKAGGGSYFDASSAEELSRSLRTVISGPFKVFDTSGKIAGKGIIGGAPIVLPAGLYRVETASGGKRVLEKVEIRPEEVTRVNF